MMLSIIIPVYNIDKYIYKSLNSLLIEDIEIIVINDGSTDNSLEKIQEVVNNNKSIKFKIINQQNKGLSETRNVGLRESTGNYIWFFDGDDFASTDNIAYLLKILNEQNEDIISVGYNLVDFDTENIIKEINSNFSGNAKIEKAIRMIGNANCNVWRYIVKRDLLTCNNIDFRKNVLCEDIEWTSKIFAKAKNVYFLNKVLYNYRVNRKGSIMANVTIKRIDDVFNNINNSHIYIKKQKLSFKIKVLLYKNLFRQYIYNIYNINFMTNDNRKNLFVTKNYSFTNKLFIKVFLGITKIYIYIRKVK